MEVAPEKLSPLGKAEKPKPMRWCQKKLSPPGKDGKAYEVVPEEAEPTGKGWE
jgi:hypothetical protein